MTAAAPALLLADAAAEEAEEAAAPVTPARDWVVWVEPPMYEVVPLRKRSQQFVVVEGTERHRGDCLPNSGRLATSSLNSSANDSGASSVCNNSHGDVVRNDGLSCVGGDCGVVEERGHVVGDEGGGD